METAGAGRGARGEFERADRLRGTTGDDRAEQRPGAAARGRTGGDSPHLPAHDAADCAVQRADSRRRESVGGGGHAAGAGSVCAGVRLRRAEVFTHPVASKRRSDKGGAPGKCRGVSAEECAASAAGAAAAGGVEDDRTDQPGIGRSRSATDYQRTEHRRQNRFAQDGGAGGDDGAGGGSGSSGRVCDARLRCVPGRHWRCAVDRTGSVDVFGARHESESHCCPGDGAVAGAAGRIGVGDRSGRRRGAGGCGGGAFSAGGRVVDCFHAPDVAQGLCGECAWSGERRGWVR